MNYEKVNAKACLIASVFLGIVYVLIFYFFPSAKESMKYKNIDFSELVHALKILYLCLFGLGVSFYKFSFKLLRTKIENIYPKLIKFLLTVFKILLYITSFLLSKTYISIFDPKPKFIFFVIHILFLIVGIVQNIITEAVFDFHSDNYNHPYLQLILGKFVFILCALPLYVDFLGGIYLLLSLF